MISQPRLDASVLPSEQASFGRHMSVAGRHREPDEYRAIVTFSGLIAAWDRDRLGRIFRRWRLKKSGRDAYGANLRQQQPSWPGLSGSED
jgi:outer membrane protein TolC